jgi:ClpP class serine protease
MGGQSVDSKLLIALLCLIAAATVVSFVIKLASRRRGGAPVQVPNLRDAAAPSSVHIPPRFVPAPRPAGRAGVKTIAVIHDFGNPGSPPDARDSLSVREAFEVLAAIREAGDGTPIDLVLHTPGGSAFACELVAGALKDRPNTTAYVPYCAMSAGTILALACEKVVMGKNACLGPIDNQFMGIPADAFQRLMKEKPIQAVDDFTALLSYMVDKEQKNAKAQACALMNKSHFAADNACMITDFLSSGDLPHSEQISRERAKALGVNVADGDCPEEIYRLVEMRLDLLGLRPLHDEGYDPDSKAGEGPVEPLR